MSKRKLFLLFLSAMSFSIIIMVIIYGVFIKDINFSLNVKDPDSAPSPVDILNSGDNNSISVPNTSDNEMKTPAKITTPDQISQQAAGNTTQDKPSTDNTVTTEEKNSDTTSEASTPHVAPKDVPPSPPTPDEQVSSQPPEVSPDNISPTNTHDNGNAATSTLHYVYLGGFPSKEAAEQAIIQLEDKNLAAQPYIRQHKGKIVLQFGVFSDKENADVLTQKLRSQNVNVKED